jgi:predicted alpha/beta-hydrolase family hydrolase
MKLKSVLLPGHQGQAELLQYSQPTPSKRLLLLLPGRYYATDRSPLELLAEMGTQNGWDVLGFRYSFQVSPYPTENLTFDQLEREVLGILPHLAGYQEVCLGGKSMGSSMARRLLGQTQAQERSLLLITPLNDSFAGAATVPRLCLIGDQDPLFDQTASARAAHPAEWRVYPGADHSLQVQGDWRATAGVWQALVADAESFLAR